MKILLDTHTFLWWIIDNPLIPEKSREIIGNYENEIYLSAASGFEIAIKYQLGKLDLDTQEQDLETFINEQLEFNSIQPLLINMNHSLHVNTLPLYHRDPFDRLIVSQAQLENLPIITKDPQIKRYDVVTIWD